jgi:Na+:H+ antiporter, NhaA family
MTRFWRFVADHYLVVPVGGALALVWANTDPETYFRFANACAFAVNEIGMALVVAFLAQEVVEAALPGGSLYPFTRAAVPLIGGVGGTVGAAIAYFAYVALGDEHALARGWPVSGAADLIVALAVARAIFGRSPAVAMAAIIALSSDVIGFLIISPQHLVAHAHPIAVVLILLGTGVAALLRQRGVVSSWPYLVIGGSLSWCGCYWSGVQPVLSLLPIVPFLRHAPRDFAVRHDEQAEHRKMTHFESVFEVPAQIIALLFGFVNIGFRLRGVDTGTWAIASASLVGRPIGTLAAIGAATVIGLPLPRGTGWKEAVVAALAAAPTAVFGVLFAVSIFPVGPLLVQTKLGAMATVIGLLPAFAAARLLSVGRFAVGEMRHR